MGLFYKEQKQKQMNIMLTDEDFQCLVRGGTLTVNANLRLGLQDIGFDRMHMAIDSAEARIDVGKPRNRETNHG